MALAVGTFSNHLELRGFFCGYDEERFSIGREARGTMRHQLVKERLPG
jgi:hypothetical protein